MTISQRAAPVRSEPKTAGARGTLAFAVLFLVATVNFMDRQLPSILAEPIRAEFHLSDTEFGLLTGLSFALVYSLLGIPVAMLADRGGRVRLIAVACLVWSAFTSACGLASSFAWLATARVGVGIGEAGSTPPSLSLLADLYPPQRRPLMVGLLSTAGPIGLFLAAFLGGRIAHTLGWRSAFVAVGLLGLVASLLLWLCVKEPDRGSFDPSADAPRRSVPLAETLSLFAKDRALCLLAVAAALSAFSSLSVLAWVPAFLMRDQGMTLAQIGSWFGPVVGIAMGIGIFGGGALVNWFARRSARAYAFVPGVAITCAAPFLAAALLVDGWRSSLMLIAVPIMLGASYTGPVLSLAQNLAPVNARATVAALLVLVINLAGTGAGPLVVGAISDAVKPGPGAGNLRVALLCVPPVCLLAGFAYLLLARALLRVDSSVFGSPANE